MGAQQCRFCTQKKKEKRKKHFSKPQTLNSTSISNAIFRVYSGKDWRKVSALKAQKSSSRDANLLSSEISSEKRESELVLSCEEGLKKSIENAIIFGFPQFCFPHKKD
jgi:hypothetical protein